MEFVEYDETVAHYDKPTRSALKLLSKQFGAVEIKQVSTREFCVRIRATISGVDTPMATVGSSVLEAAERLLRVMNLPG